MSFDVMHHDRKVQIIPITMGTEDEYGNIVPVRGEPFEVWTRRAQLTAAEEIVNRDQQARTFRYFFNPDVSISGYDEIEDEGKTLQVIGVPEIMRAMFSDHHIEALAQLVEG